ncbi:unnamed protein product [Chilo suppressalis]|uniref:CCHC-type domain-containing protein n=1 Tax=Chilo suppressalis TaxID=168631 RepID=A0ABN8B092_CHISP|nr:unnamed protein product [Chilo suppressalis]
MDFITVGCPVEYLHKDELLHELSIRHLPAETTSSTDDLRKLLRHTCKLARRGSVKAMDNFTIDQSSEVAICTPKVAEIEASSKDLTSSERMVKRLVARCNYLLCRLSRISNPEDGIAKLKSSLICILMHLESDSDEPEETGESFSTPEKEVVETVQVVQQLSPKVYNLNSFNLKYRGDSCVRVFLTRLEELRVARKVPKDVIFDSFPDILEGPALYWFRANKSKFQCYSEVIKLLDEDFDIPDLDYLLLCEIRQRTQAKFESIVMFLSVIIGMFSRLKKHVPEDEQLDIILRNIRPEYIMALALHDITSIMQLKFLCKKLELAKAKASQFHEPVLKTDSFAPDFNYLNLKTNVSKFKNQNGNNNHKINSLKTITNKNIKLNCFRCGLKNHDTSECQKSRKVVCFKCGKSGVRILNCPKCNPPKPNIKLNKHSNKFVSNFEAINRKGKGPALSNEPIIKINSMTNSQMNSGFKSPKIFSLPSKDKSKKSQNRNTHYFNKRKSKADLLRVGQLVYKKCFPQCNAVKHFTSQLVPKYEKSVVSDGHPSLISTLKSPSGENIDQGHISNLVQPGDSVT